jgi:hypothetical protein
MIVTLIRLAIMTQIIAGIYGLKAVIKLNISATSSEHPVRTNTTLMI